MSKARDLANAGTALTTVSATELGYLDGVTSAVQTQIDSKEATLPSQTGNSGKYLTTNGTAKSWGTVSQYALPSQTGNSGKYLTTNGTSESWGTVSAGPGNLVQIATGTLSGTSVSITGLSSYTNLHLFVTGVVSGSNQSNTGVRINNNSGSNYTFFGGYWYDYYQAPVVNINTTGFYISRDRAVSTDNTLSISFTECKTPGYTAVDAINATYASGINATQIDAYKGYYKVDEAVSSIQIFNPGGFSFTAGTYTLLGA